MASSQSNLSVNLEGKFVGFHGGEAAVLRGDAGRGSIVAAGGLVVIAAGQEFDVFSSEIKESALRIAEDSADFSVEMCRLCGVVKRIGLLDRIYQIQTGAPAPRCVCTPVDEL